jgi:AraC family transcriptional regulator
MAVAEYVRRRRLSLAAIALAGSGVSALEAAVEAGYASQAAFSRAFAREFGLSPTGFRRRFAMRDGGVGIPPGLVAPFEPRLPFEPPQPRVRVAELPGLSLLGVGIRSGFRAYASFRELPIFWDDWMRRRRWREVPNLEPGRPVYGLCAPSIEREFEYYICVEAPEGVAGPPGWRKLPVAPGRYAISEASGPQPLAIQGATLAAYARWLPASGFGRGSGWDVEAYFPRIPGEPDKSELRLPLA